MPLPDVGYSFHWGGRELADWRVVHAHVREALSEPYACSLILAADPAMASLEDLLPDPGSPEPPQPVALRMARAGVAERWVQGVIRAVEDLGTTAAHQFVRVTIAPWLWTLSQRTDARIFQGLNVAEIVRSVLDAAGVYQGDGRSRFDGSLFDHGQHPPREYCVQYQETDLAFVSRLLEEEGLPYYFAHDGHAAGEALVVADDAHRYEAIAGDPVEVLDAGAATTERETVQWFDLARELRPTGVTVRDFDFTRPGSTATALTAAQPGAQGPRPLYVYPARAAITNYGEGSKAYATFTGSRHARVRLEEQLTRARAGVGRGVVTELAPGRSFTLSGHGGGHGGGEPLDGRYLVTAVEHVGTSWGRVFDDVRGSERLRAVLEGVGVAVPAGERAGGDTFASRFRCNAMEGIATSVAFRPARATSRPVVEGPQTATVVGPEGEEIYVDFHGRIKVQFHWDREGQRDEASSCWVRVAQTWAGAGWGFQFVPRIGMEVVVVFMEGDPDRPLVVGCVYNGERHTPYALPDEKTRSTLKTSSSPTSGGYNELRFEDKAGEEQVYVQAERNMDALVKNDQTLTVGKNRTKMVRGNERNTVVRNRATLVQGNESKEVEGNQDVQVHGYGGATLRVDENYLVTAGQTVVVEVGQSKITMTRDAITVASKVVNVFGESLVDIRGGLVKINCDEARAPKAQRKQSRLQKLMDKARRAVDRALSKLPKPLQKLVKKLARRALKRTLTALMQGRLPDLRAMGREAVQGAAGTAVGEVFGRLGAMDFVRGNPLLQMAMGEAQRRAEGAVTRGLRVAGALRDELVREEAWQRVEREQPEVAQRVLRSAARPVAREEMVKWSPPAGSGRDGVRVFDAAGSAMGAGLRAGVVGMV